MNTGRKDPKSATRLAWCIAETLERRTLLSGGSSKPDPWSTINREDALTVQEIPVQQVGQWGGPIDAVFTSGSTGYIGQGPSLVSIDLSDPTRPIEMGRIALPGIVNGLEVSGTYAYVANDKAGLQIVNVSNPAALVLMGGCDTPGFAASVSVAGNYAYVADSGSGLQIIDISNPVAPTLVGCFDTNGYAGDVSVSGSHAYVADWLGGLQIIDISSPGGPVWVGSYDATGHAYAVSVSGTYAYVADGEAGMQIIDISNPDAPVGLGSYRTGGYAGGLSVAGGYAYMANDLGGLYVIDVSSPASPLCVGNYLTSGSSPSVKVFGTYAYVADGEAGLQVIDVSNPAAPVRVGRYNTSGYTSGVSVAGNYAYVTSSLYNGSGVEGSLQIFDISTPSDPVPVGSCGTSGYAYDLTVSGSYAYVADGPGGLQIIDVSNPIAPVWVGGCSSIGSAYGVSVSGGYAYMAIGDDGTGLQIIDISDPANPVWVGAYSTSVQAFDVSVSGSYAWVAAWNGGLQIIDISDPADPAWVGSYDTIRYATGVRVANNYAYVASADGLQVIDVSNAAVPAWVGSCDIGGGSAVSVSSGYAYMASNLSGLHVVDISNPASPVRVGGHDTSGSASDVSVSGAYAYVADAEGGLVVLRIGTMPPTDVMLSSNAVPENQTDGTLVGTLSATDPDAGDTFTFALSTGDGDSDNPLFRIVGNELRTAASFDYETQPSYFIRIQVTDSGGLSYQEAFTIAATDLQEFGLLQGRPQKFPLSDTDGDQVTFSLTGGGSGTIQPDGRITLSSTTAKSVLSIGVKKANAGDGYYALPGISADGLLKSVSAAKVFLTGELSINTTSATAGASTVTISLAGITDAGINTFTQPIRSLKLMNWQDTDATPDQLTTPWIGSITVTGRKDNPKSPANEYLPGNWDADILTSAADSRGLALGTLKAAGSIRNAALRLSGSANIISAKGSLQDTHLIAPTGLASLTASALHDSDILVGVVQNFEAAFATTASAFTNPAARLAKLTITGQKLPKGQLHPAYVTSSHISAPTADRITLTNVPADSVPFLHLLTDTATLSLKTLSPAMLPAGTWRPGIAPRSGQPPRPDLLDLVE